MSEQFQVVAADAISFVEKFIKAVKDGYRLCESTEGYPQDAIVKSVMLFKTPERPVHKEKMGLKFKKISAMDRFDFVSQLQQAVIEGFEPDYNTLYWAVLKEVQLKEVKQNIPVESVPEADKPEEKKRGPKPKH